MQMENNVKTPISSNLSPEERKEMVKEGWDIDACDALFMNDQPPDAEQVDSSLPMEVLLHGFSVSSKHPIIGYVVELWLHNTGFEPYYTAMRPRYAIKLADLIEGAVSKKGFESTPKSITTDFEETINVYKWIHGGVFITTDEIRLGFEKPRAKILAAQLRQAAVAHRHAEHAILAA